MTDDEETADFINEAKEFGHSLLIEAWEQDDAEEEE